MGLSACNALPVMTGWITSPVRSAGLAGLSILALGVAGRWAIGEIYSTAKAFELIDAMRSSALYLGSAMATSSGTTLALMLAMVGLVRRADEEFDREVYLRVRTIAQLSTMSLIGSVVMLLVLTLPIGDFQKMPPFWYPWLYNAIYAMVVALSALLVGTVTMLFTTLSALIAKITPTGEL